MPSDDPTRRATAETASATAIPLDGVPHPSLTGRSLLTLQNHSPAFFLRVG